MAGIKISDLPPVVAPALSDIFPIDQGLVTYKESAQQLLTLFQANGAALTEVNDTNVTMTLGGSPATALLNATSMTLGWAGQLAVGRGGTGNSTFTAYSVICAGTTATGAFQNVSGLGTSGFVLTSNGAGTLPTWQAATTVTPAALTKVDDTNVTLTLGGTPATALLQATSITAGWTGTLSATRGGLGLSNPTAHGILVGEGASAVNPIVLSSGQILVGSTGVDPVAAAINSGTGILVANGAGSITVNLAAIASNDILSNITAGSAAPIANTLTATIDAAIGSTQGDILYRNASAWVVLAPGSSGQFLQSQGAGANPQWATVSAFTTSAVTSSPVTAVAGNAYINNDAGGLLTVNLPATCALGDTIGVLGTPTGSFGWTLVTNGVQTINFGNTTSSGGGALASTQNSDWVYVVCVVANSTWKVIYGGAALTVS